MELIEPQNAIRNANNSENPGSNRHGDFPETGGTFRDAQSKAASTVVSCCFALEPEGLLNRERTETSLGATGRSRATDALRRGAFFALAVVLGFLLLELPWNDGVFAIPQRYVVDNLLILGLGCAIVFLAGQRTRASLAVFTGFCLLWGTANFFIITFKGQPSCRRICSPSAPPPPWRWLQPVSHRSPRVLLGAIRHLLRRLGEAVPPTKARSLGRSRQRAGGGPAGVPRHHAVPSHRHQERLRRNRGRMGCARLLRHPRAPRSASSRGPKS